MQSHLNEFSAQDFGSHGRGVTWWVIARKSEPPGLRIGRVDKRPIGPLEFATGRPV